MPDTEEAKTAEEIPPAPQDKEATDPSKVMFYGKGRGKENERDGTFLFDALDTEEPTSADLEADREFVTQNKPTTELEKALTRLLKRKTLHAERLKEEMIKVKEFICKRKQTYKRKRKLDGAPTRALSAYNIFIKDRFARLAKENEQALKSDSADAKLLRVASADLVSETGNIWKTLPAEEKAKYEERALSDRKRYEEEMAMYQPPDKNANRKRNKTGYNMFFSAHVLRLKQSESGVPSERGSVARLVGVAWKQLSVEDKQFYEREADKHNGANPVPGVPEEEEEIDEKHVVVPQPMEHYYPQDMHMHMPPPMHHHDPRQHHPYYAATYGQPAGYAHYDYSQHQRHQGRSQQQQQQQQQQGYQQPPPHPNQGGYQY